MNVADYVNQGHRRVQGWLRPEAAQLIAALAQSQTIGGAVGEIGVHHGKLFILLALCRRSGELGVAIDVFEDQSLNIDNSGAGDREKFLANLNACGIAPESIVIEQADSTTMTSDRLLEMSTAAFRLFSVDGGHTADITENDLHLASDALAEGGLLVLDDYFNVSWPGVSEGANRFLTRRTNLIAFASGHGKMFFTHRASIESYRSIITTLAIEKNWKVTEQEFFGEKHLIVELRHRSKNLRALRHRLAVSRFGRAVRGRTHSIR